MSELIEDRFSVSNTLDGMKDRRDGLEPRSDNCDYLYGYRIEGELKETREMIK